MRTEPTWRIPFGVLLLMVGLALYALGVAWLSQWIGLLPLRRFLVWMQTGKFR